MNPDLPDTDDFHLPPSTHEGLFSLAVPGLQLAWDSTSLGLLKECPRKYFYTIILGWQPSGFAAHLAFGIAYHKALENYDKLRFAGADHINATVATMQFCMSYGERDDDGKFLPYNTFFTREPHKTRNTLCRAVIWYLEEFRHDTLRTYELSDGTPAVELSFKLSLELESPDDKPFLLCGHLDRVVTLNDDILILDRKTTKQISPRYFSQFTPNNQMSLYYSAGQVVLPQPASGIIIDAAEIGVTYVRFKRHQLHRTLGQQREWLKDTYHWITQAMMYASEGYWPMNDKACGNFGGCAFQIICSRDPKVRQTFLEREGYHHRRWNPLENR